MENLYRFAQFKGSKLFIALTRTNMVTSECTHSLWMAGTQLYMGRTAYCLMIFKQPASGLDR